MRQRGERGETARRVAFLKGGGPWGERGKTAWKEIAWKRANPAIVPRTAA